MRGGRGRDDERRSGVCGSACRDGGAQASREAALVGGNAALVGLWWTGLDDGAILRVKRGDGGAEAGSVEVRAGALWGRAPAGGDRAMRRGLGTVAGAVMVMALWAVVAGALVGLDALVLGGSR